MVPTIVKPTRITETTASLIDNTFINFFDDAYSAGIIYDDIADHLPTFIEFSFKRNKDITQTTKQQASRHLTSENFKPF